MRLSKTLVREVSRLCVDELSRQVATRAALMPLAELRGYIRAHARGTLRAYSVASLGNNGPDSTRVDELIDAALSRTVHLVTSACQLPPIIAISPPHVGEVAQPISLPIWGGRQESQRDRLAA
jgi:hypothetical protein